VVSTRVVGHQFARLDGVDKVTGKAQYAADIAVPGMLWGKSLLSPYPHARIISIDTSAAEALPGVRAVVTGRDTTGLFFGRALKDINFLADGKVRYVGDRVAAVAADDEATAEAALELIEVDYEELPAVYDPEEAAQPGAPIVHPDYNSYNGARRQLETPSNAYGYSTVEKGDVDKGFAEADFVVEHTYRLQRQHHAYMEPQAVIISTAEADGRIHIWTCNKVPYLLRDAIAVSFGVPNDQILFHPMYVGGDFGGKSAPASLPIAYFLARTTGKPVKMVHDYIEEFMAGTPKHAAVYHLKTGVKRDGTLLAHQIKHYVNMGAYAGYTPGGQMGGATVACGPYKIANVKTETFNVYTNCLSGQIMRAPGEPEAVFAIESHMDEIARQIGMDPLDLRLKNLIESGDELANGEKLEKVRAKETLRAAVAAGKYGQAKPAHVGRGIAIGDRGAGMGQATLEVTLNPDGSCVLGSALFDQGTGSITSSAQVVAEELNVDPDKISVVVRDTDFTAFANGLAGSVQSRLSTVVAHEAAEEAKKNLTAFAAQHLGWPEDRTNFRAGELVRTDLEERVTWQEMLRQAGESMTARAQIRETDRGHVTSFVGQVAEVSVDPDTGEVKLLDFTTAHDIAHIINPVGHQGQINGGVMQGIGYAMMEELIVEDGHVTNLSFGDYKVPTIRDIPHLNTVLLPSDDGVGPYNVKGIGEHPTIPVAAAIANAVEDAIGVRIRDLPITAEKVYKALQEKK
jgi:CO/xanthine dehydrogenase Mo-binding subunit